MKVSAIAKTFNNRLILCEGRGIFIVRNPTNLLHADDFYNKN